MTMVRYCLSFFLFSFCAASALAQNDDCELTIDRALNEFNAGHFYNIPSILNPCLGQFTAEQRQRANLLLTQTYLLLDDPIGARQSYLGVLKANPEFVTDTALHPIDVIYLSKKFTATPVFSWFGKVGPTASFARPIHEQNTVGEHNVRENYEIRLGYHASVGGDFNISEKIAFRAELMFMMATFTHRSYNFFNFDAKTVIDRQSWLGIPVTVMYTDAAGKFRPYGYVGYSFQYLLADKATITITNDRPSSTASELAATEREKTPEESPQLDMLYKRNRMNQSMIVGGGLKIKIGLDYLFFDLRYAFGLKNIVSEENTYGDYSQSDLTSPRFVQSMEPSLKYMHVDDYFRLDNLALSVGFLRPLYKPRELKHARTKSVMKQMRNK